MHPDGNVYPCTDRQSEEHRVGRVLDDVFEYNTNFKCLAINNHKCHSCFAFYQCAGECVMNIPKDEKGQCATFQGQLYCNTIQYYWRKVFAELCRSQRCCDLLAEEITDFPLKYKAYLIKEI